MPFKIRIHRSFLHLFVIVLVVMAVQGRGAEGLVRFTGGFLLLFVAVIAHELSHAAAARALGVRVRDIVLHPLGGMTRLDWGARDPKREALISSAGPAMNLVLAGATWLAAGDRFPSDEGYAAWMALFFAVNAALGILNLIPAFPMDGGRILRALLSVRMGHLAATRLAARIGRWIAALTLVAPFLAPAFGWSFWQALVLPLLGLFVFVLGEIELKQAEATEFLSKVSAAMRGAAGSAAPSGRHGDADVIDVTASARVVDDDRPPVSP